MTKLISGCLSVEREESQSAIKKLRVDIFIILIITVVLKVYAYVRIYQIVCLKHVWFMVYQLYFTEVIFKKQS